MAILDSNNRVWGQTKIQPWWSTEYRDLPYRYEPFNDPETRRLWMDLGFENQRFTGDLYDMRYVQPDFVKPFQQKLPLKFFSWSLYRMTPGTVLPQHGDTYKKFCELHDIDDIMNIRRYLVMLEDWQSGHYFELANTVQVPWKAGDVFYWHGDCPHLAANMGHTNRYTLQITGVVE
jgi:hypothetical protein